MAKIAKKITLSFTPDEIKEILEQHIAENYENLPDNVTINFKVGTHLRGYGMNEYEETTFDGADAVCES